MPDIPTLNTEDEYRVIVCMRETTYQTLCAYAAMKRGTVEYVLTAAVEYMLATKRDFIEWRRHNSESFLPPGAKPIRRTTSTPRAPRRTREVSTAQATKSTASPSAHGRERRDDSL